VSLNRDLVEMFEYTLETAYYSRWGYDGLGTPGPKLPYRKDNLVLFGATAGILSMNADRRKAYKRFGKRK
jgi:hypothetical protein